jgi:gliding motility-associated-like protein
MKDWFKHIILFVLLATFTGPLLNAVEYLRQDTTITYYVNKGNNVSALYEWTITPSISSFNPGFDTVQTIKWSGDTSLIYTLIITPKDTAYGICDGDPDTMQVKLYSGITPILPVNVQLGNYFTSICSPLSGSASVNTSVYVSNYSGTFTLSYQVDNNPTITLLPATVSPVTINVNSGLTAGTDHHNIRITKIETFTSPNQPITQNYSNDIMLNVAMKAIPALGDISSVNIDASQKLHVQSSCATGTPKQYSISGGAGMIYHWSSDLGNSVFTNNFGKATSDTLKDSIYVTWPKQVTNHTLNVFGVVGVCPSYTKILSVNIDSLPQISLGKDAYLCQGHDTTFRIEGNYQVQWSDLTHGPTYTTNKNDTVVVIVTNSKKCVSRDTAIVKVYPLPAVSLAKETMLCGEHKLLLDAGNKGGRYLWSVVGIQPQTIGTSQTITIDKSNGDELISVKVSVTEPSGIECSTSDTIHVLKCDTLFDNNKVPYAFTPNNDNYNEYWVIPALSDHTKAVVQVYDRWGRLVYQSEPGYPDNKKWDGRDLNGKPVPMDNYFYIINFNEKNSSPVHGNITIIR